MKYFYMLVFLSLSVLSQVTAQTRQLITLTCSGIAFNDFINRVEAQTSYRFYYKADWTDSLRVTLDVSNQPLKQVMDVVLSGTALKYSTDAQGNVYITYQREIMESLPPNFFHDRNNVTREAVVFDYSDYEKKEKQKQLAETKLYNIGPKTTNLQGTATIAGSVKNTVNGEPVIGAAVFIENPTIGVATDQFGYFALTIPKGRHEIKIKSVGMKSTQRQVMLYGNGKLDIELDEDVTPLKEVVVESERDARVQSVQMGMEKLDIKTMKQMPLALGETDIMKVVLALPGVQSVGEGTVGLNVRGGATNQNLILLNDAIVYNPSHMFGFFSTFNPDVLKNVELYKSGITAEYGGRLSSVLDVHTREGNQKKFSGAGGISPITGRFTLEGPILKDKTSFIIGARSTYSDWILGKLKSQSLRNSKASFYDFTGNITHKFDDNNTLYLSGYYSQDHFRLGRDTTYSYSDRNAVLKWKHVFNTRLYGVLTGGISKYQYAIESERIPTNAFTLNFAIKQYNAKADFNYFPNSKHTITAGASVIRYQLTPGNLEPKGSESLVVRDRLQQEQGMESALYAGENFEVSRDVSVYVGLRYSYYQYLGKRDIFVYEQGAPREEGSITDTLHYNKGKAISTYQGLEPRASVRYALAKNASVKLSYNRMRQYIQMLSNTTAITPTDIWKLSDPYIRPQVGDQISLGFYKNLRGNLIETSVEAYYKTMQNTIDYKGGAVLLLNHHLETDILHAQGKAYGLELLVKKSSGKLNGWVSYTYSRSFLKTKGEFASETINKGKYYRSNFDKPHAVNFIGNYKFSRRFNFSLNVVYSTGRPITLPIAKYELAGSKRLYYSDRNQFRIPDYFRTDISINIEGNHKIRKLAHSSWTFAIYNLTGRRNAYSVFFVSKDGVIKGYKLSVFGQPIPTITYNFKF
jgi:hypothetical protein